MSVANYLHPLNAEHWLIFGPVPETEERGVVGCHCGFKSDVNQHSGYGDDVADHLLKAGADAAETEARDRGILIAQLAQDWADKCCDHPNDCACTMGQAVRFAREHAA